MSKEMEKELENCINALSEVFEAEHAADYFANFKDKLDGLNLEKLSDWEMFQFSLKEPLTQYVKDFYRTNHPDILPDNLNKLCMFYDNFDFIHHNIERIIDLGRGCCVDKTGFVMKSYVIKMISEKEITFPERDSDDHSYYHPDFGTSKDWFEFIESLFDLSYGHPNKYFHSFKELSAKKQVVEEQIEKDAQICRDFIPKYLEIMEANKEAFTVKEYNELTRKIHVFTIVNTMLQDIKNESVTAELVIKKGKEIYKKYFDYK